MKIEERVRKIRDDQPGKMSQTDFGKLIGVSRDVINNIENGRVVPSDAMLRLIAVTYRVNLDWLQTGEGDPYVMADTVEQAVDRFMAGADDFQKNTFKAFAEMGDDQWRWLKALVDKIAGNEKSG